MIGCIIACEPPTKNQILWNLLVLAWLIYRFSINNLQGRSLPSLSPHAQILTKINQFFSSSVALSRGIDATVCFLFVDKANKRDLTSNKTCFSSLPRLIAD